SRYDFECNRYGPPRPSESVGLRDAGSRKYGCRFRCTATRIDRRWVLYRYGKPDSYTHNHGQSITAYTYP
ncbi:hypothetical protein QBC39DRAFT_270638, partial [Podospora conica]